MSTLNSSATALCIGEALVDVIVHHQDPDPVEVPGGSPANVALALGRLERPVTLATYMAHDRFGDMITQRLTDSNVQLDTNSYMAKKTSSSKVSVDQDGNPSFTFDFDWQITPIDVRSTDIVLHTGSLAATQDPGCERVLEAISRGREQATVFYDPNIRPTLMSPPERTYEQFKAFCKVSDVVKVSDADLSHLFKSGDLHSLAMKILSWGPKLVVITQGAMGAEAWCASGATCQVDAVQAEIVDTVGCGDAFTAGLIDRLWDWQLLGAGQREALGQLNVEQLESLLHYALLLAAMTISRQGANPPRLSEVQK